MATRSKVKTLKREETKDTRPVCHARHIRISPYKMRSVAALVRNKPYAQAIAILSTIVKSSSDPIRKAIESAAANAEVKNMSRQDLFVAEIYIDQGPTMKRVMARARGSADRILKRSSHITVILDNVANIKTDAKEAK